MNATAQDGRSYRLSSIDFLRGLVIVIMAIDHARDNFYAGAVQDPMSDPNISIALYFTRWITHFCAPTFTLLAGVSAGLMVLRKTPTQLGGFLLSRGVWLVFTDAVIISTATTFAPFGISQDGGRTWIIFQTLWAIGLSMVALSAAQFLGRRACLVLGACILVGHNMLDGVWPAGSIQSGDQPLWVALHSQIGVVTEGLRILIAYPVLPWVGVMLFGFGASSVFELPPQRRDKVLRITGFAMVVGFVLLRASHWYGDPNPWEQQSGGVVATLLDFLNTTKYPPSLLFVLMTIGPGAILCSYADRLSGAIKNALVMFGRVPFVFYVAHFYLLHVLVMALGAAQGFPLGELMVPFMFYPKGYGVPLVGVYLIWAVVVAILYPLCRWTAGIKAKRKDWWLSYL